MTLIPPEHNHLAWKKSVDRRIRDHSAQLVVPSAYPASPYGGAGPPTNTWFIPVTTGTFADTQPSQPWLVQLDRVTSRAFSIDIPWATDSATVGELRLSLPFGTNSPTSVVNLPAASSGTKKFRWVHGYPIWESYDVWVFIEARRVSGAGNVYIGYPIGGGVQVGPSGCSETGL